MQNEKDEGKGCEKIRKLENHFWKFNIQLKKMSGGENNKDGEK